MTGIGIWIIGIVASVILTILLTEPITFLLASIFGGIFRTKQGISGIWEGKISFSSDGKENEETHLIVIKQFGKHIIGKNITGHEIRKFRLKGSVSQQRFITGVWQSQIVDLRTYHGAFQLGILPQNTEIEGKWIGFNKNSHVQEGNWRWKLISRKNNKSEVKRILNEMKPAHNKA